MGKVKKGFIFRAEWADLLSGVSDDVRLSLYDAMVAYALHGESVSFDSDIARVAFSFLRTMIDRDEAKSSHIRAVRSAAGKRGMEVRYSKKSDVIQE